MALAARTRQRMRKYGVLQLRMLDLFVLKRVRVDPAHLKSNLVLQRGHPYEYEAMLRAASRDEEADSFIQKVMREKLET